MFEWTINGRDPTRGNARIACRRVQLGMAEKGLDKTNIYPLLEQVRGERVAKRMQADPLGNAGGYLRFMEEAHRGSDFVPCGTKLECSAAQRVRRESRGTTDVS